jgi:hypothetical protein
MFRFWLLCQQFTLSFVIQNNMTDQANNTRDTVRTRTIKDLVNTPFKKAMLVVQLLSYVLIVASPIIGGLLGRALGLKTAQTGGLILGVFIAGEVLFYTSLAFLGKELVLLIRDKIKARFKRKKRL